MVDQESDALRFLTTERLLGELDPCIQGPFQEAAPRPCVVTTAAVQPLGHPLFTFS